MDVKCYREQNRKARRILMFVNAIEKTDEDRNEKLSHANRQLALLTEANRELILDIERVIKEKAWEFEQ